MNLNEEAREVLNLFSKAEDTLKAFKSCRVLDISVIFNFILRVSRTRFESQMETLIAMRSPFMAINGSHNPKEMHTRNESLQNKRTDWFQDERFRILGNLREEKNFLTATGERKEIHNGTMKDIQKKINVLNNLQSQHHSKILRNTDPNNNNRFILVQCSDEDVSNNADKEIKNKNVYKSRLKKFSVDSSMLDRSKQIEKSIESELSMCTSELQMLNESRFNRSIDASNQQNLLSYTNIEDQKHMPEPTETGSKRLRQLISYKYTAELHGSIKHPSHPALISIKNDRTPPETGIPDKLQRHITTGLASLLTINETLAKPPQNFSRINDILNIEPRYNVSWHKSEHRQTQIDKIYNELLEANADLKKSRDDYISHYQEHLKRKNPASLSQIAPTNKVFQNKFRINKESISISPTKIENNSQPNISRPAKVVKIEEIKERRSASGSFKHLRQLRSISTNQSADFTNCASPLQNRVPLRLVNMSLSESFSKINPLANALQTQTGERLNEMTSHHCKKNSSPKINLLSPTQMEINQPRIFTEEEYLSFCTKKLNVTTGSLLRQASPTQLHRTDLKSPLLFSTHIKNRRGSPNEETILNETTSPTLIFKSSLFLADYESPIRSIKQKRSATLHSFEVSKKSLSIENKRNPSELSILHETHTLIPKNNASKVI